MNRSRRAWRSKMCVMQRGFVSETEGDNMTSQARHHGAGSQLYPNQCDGSCIVHDQGFVKIKGAGENVLSRLQASFQILSSICFCKELLFLCSMAFMVTHAHGEEQTGICFFLEGPSEPSPECPNCWHLSKLMDPAIIWDTSSLLNLETIGLLSPCSTTQQLPVQWMNVCIPHVHRNVENHSPDSWETPIPFRANVLVTVLAIIGGMGLAGRMLYKRCRAFTEGDINMGLMSEPAVPRRSNPTFKIHPRIE